MQGKHVNNNVRYVIAIVAGAAVWLLIVAISGRNEAWDTGAYFTVGIPLVCLTSAVLAYFAPERSWRWGVLPMVGQFLCLLVMQGPGNLLPLGIIVFAVLSIPSIIAARIGASIGLRTARRDQV